MLKIEKRHSLPSLCIYFDKTFTEMFLEQSSISQIIYAHCSFSLFAMEIKLQKNKYLKDILLKNNMLHGAEALLKYSSNLFLQIIFFCMCVCVVFLYENYLSRLVVMAT